MLHTKYQALLFQEEISHFPYISQCRTCDPWYNLNRLGRDRLGDAAYQMSIV